MSPRRRIQPGEEPLLTEQLPESTLWSRLPVRLALPRHWWKPSREWAMPLAMAVAGVSAVGVRIGGCWAAAAAVVDGLRRYKRLAERRDEESFRTADASSDSGGMKVCLADTIKQTIWLQRTRMISTGELMLVRFRQ